jgi:hypothetical protein
MLLFLSKGASTMEFKEFLEIYLSLDEESRNEFEAMLKEFEKQSDFRE